jgi:bacillithiol biosynthesis deacetylase BshB1
MNILVVGPHPDDQELGMGGSIARFAEQGHRVLLLDLTNGEPTPHGSVETRAKEAAEAARLLSAPNNPVRRVLLDLPNRRVLHSIEARHKVAAVIRAHQAQVMFVPYGEDAHPDHIAATRIAEDARFDAKLTGLDLPPVPGLGAVGPPIYPKWLFHYYATHLRIVPHPSFLIDISAQVEKKVAAIDAYRSQFQANPKNRQVPEWIRAEGQYLGSRIGAAAAEPFFAREPIGLTGLDTLAL